MIDAGFGYKGSGTGKSETPSSFSSVSIKVASPNEIRRWSSGEVKNPETINYRSFKPEKGGLFCERIFGPSKDWECSCGKYKRVKYKGVKCDRCEVEVTLSRVRRERMGHIELAVPVSHIWFFKCSPSKIGLMLDMTTRALERVIYYEEYVVIDPGETPLQPCQTLTEIEHREAQELYGEKSFVAEMGAPAIQTLLANVDLKALKIDLQQKMIETKSKAIRKKIAKRLRLVEGFSLSGSEPQWMILEVLPVIPPELRPLVPLEGGRFATYDLNDLYRRVIYRNNRLRNLLQLRTPEVIIRNEKRMLQEAVDALLDNGRHGRAITGAGNRPLKSLSDMLKGKGGRFRQNLLGKRVDYSGRSVIVVGPELKLDQCGLPKKMALTLFEPFIIRHLKDSGKAHTVKSSKKMIERGEPEVWDILEKVTKGHPILLNRAPTLHRLSIQAFNPVLIEGSAIRLHPLVCTAYNADFDGDQMAVHVPLSNEAQLECKLLMLASNNIFSPSNGRPITTPTQDITLGAYYLTVGLEKKGVVIPAHPHAFGGIHEVLMALEFNNIELHTPIIVPNPDYQRKTHWGDAKSKYLTTTPGHVIFNEIWDASLGFFNKVADKKSLGKLVADSYSVLGRETAVKILDRLKAMGYEYATKSGLSISITDLEIPTKKQEEIEKSRKEVEKYQRDHEEGALTEVERRSKIQDIWTGTTQRVTEELIKTLKVSGAKGEINPVYVMLNSGARGNRDQIRQLAGMRGLMAKPSGEIIERPILSSFREGLTVLEYFISTHGARKGLADTALKTADSGYLTRKLVDVAQDLICRQDDCGTINGIWLEPIVEGGDVMVKLEDRIIGRYCGEDIKDTLTPKAKDGSVNYLVRHGEYIDEILAAKIIERGVEKIKIRSPLTCEAEFGLCLKCYGKNLATGKLAEIGDSLGIIAAQSIGEPGTQLTMRTFHIGGTASSAFREPKVKFKNSGLLAFEEDARLVVDMEGKLVALKAGIVSVCEQSGPDGKTIGIEIERANYPIGAIFAKRSGDLVKGDEAVCEWEPHSNPILTSGNGVIKFNDLIEGVTLNRISKGKGVEEVTVTTHGDDLHPQLIVKNPKTDEIVDHHHLPSGAYIMVKEGDAVAAGAVLARSPRQLTKNKDITGGLPRVTELFDARRPKDLAEIARMSGRIEMGKMQKGKRQVIVRDVKSTDLFEEHSIDTKKHLQVMAGDIVEKGQKLTEGAIDPHDLLEICGTNELQHYLVREVQLVYRSQDVQINDKHIEIIVRQMLQKVRIVESGDTSFLPGEQVDRQSFNKENQKAVADGRKPGEAEPVLLGITKAATEANSFISAASFQDTTRVLTDAATLGKVDMLLGFKECVITGHLIPAGTGSRQYEDIRVVPLVREPEPEVEDFFAAHQAKPKVVEVEVDEEAEVDVGIEEVDDVETSEPDDEDSDSIVD